MKKIFALMLAAALLAAVLTGSFAFAEEEKVLNIFTWEGYFDETTLAQFEGETGIKVNYSVFASNEEMLLKMQAGVSDYDIILASDYAISAMRKDGKLLELDKSRLTNWENLNPNYLNQYFDPENVYSVPYTVGVPVIVYDPAQVEGEITAFADLWDEQFKYSLWLLDDARVMLGETLKMLGYSYNTTDANEINEAYEKLLALKDNAYVLDYDLTYNYLTSGEVKAAYLFTPYACLSLLDNPDLKCVFPEEGIGFGIDSIVIPKAAQHPENAHAFINFYLEAETAKFVAEWQAYINPNAAADELIDPGFAAMECFAVPLDLLSTSEYVEDLGADESLFQEAWTNFKLS
ncbi:MAG: spermidine/putrescine ABC transporter substrate-binding protein [Clostridia bacterium]|nr:spermidine/putrescine ABC transporter substrate-binding protein [Clostridia bacterium]